MKRKLEIFRGSGAGGGTSSSRNTTTGGSGSSSNNLVVQQQQNNNNNNRGRQSPQTSDDDEEILRLTQQNSRYRFGNPFGYVGGGGCGLGHLPSHDNNDHHDVSSPNSNHSNSSPLFTNLGRQMGRFGCGTGTTTGSGGRWSPPGFLCFATPVRSNSDDGEGGEYGDTNLAHLSDDKLTADEFLSRHGGIGGNNNSTAPPPPKQVSPEHNNTNSSNDGRNSAMSNQNGGAGGSVYTEMSGTDAQTIESTLYFDQKYSHVIQTRPPMPLFQENIVTSCGEESYSYCGGGTTSIGGGGGGGANNSSGGSSSSFLFGEGLFSSGMNNNNNVVLGNEISTIIKKRTTSQQREIDRAQQREMDRATIAAGLSNNMNYEYNSHTRR
jgi:hypothetical protein